MRFLYVRKLNVSFLFFNKSGSSLYLCFIESWLKWLRLEYEILNLNEVYENCPTVYMFVRNPLERAVTSFYWTKTFDIKSQKEKFPIDKFTNYVENLQTEIDSSEDMHLLPQLWELMKHQRVIDNDRTKLTCDDYTKYDYRKFFPNATIKIVQVEPFKQNFQALRSMCTQLMFYPYYQKLDIDIPEGVWYKKTMGQFTELDELMDPYQKLYVVFLYNFIENSFETNNHHNNLWREMLTNLRQKPEYVDLLIKINEIVKREATFLGYKNDNYISKNKFVE